MVKLRVWVRQYRKNGKLIEVLTKVATSTCVCVRTCKAGCFLLQCLHIDPETKHFTLFYTRLLFNIKYCFNFLSLLLFMLHFTSLDFTPDFSQTGNLVLLFDLHFSNM